LEGNHPNAISEIYKVGALMLVLVVVIPYATSMSPIAVTAWGDDGK
jgi:hypothetical protein